MEKEALSIGQAPPTLGMPNRDVPQPAVLSERQVSLDNFLPNQVLKRFTAAYETN
jgi:hypothetical protein